MRTRKQIRLSGYDYSQPGWYFVTVCVQNRQCLLGNIIDGKMKLNKFGKIVKNIWQLLPKHHSVKLDAFQIMPNHIHMIIHLVGAGYSRPAVWAGSSRPNINGSENPTPTGTTLGQIVAYFKYQSTKQINVRAGYSRPAGSSRPFKKIFQRSFYKHIIRNKIELNRIRQYIINNPKNWNTDKNNIKN